MAEVAFAPVVFNGNGKVWRAGPLASGDTTGVLRLPDGNNEVSVQVSGTANGSTTAIQGSIVGSVFTTLDDAFGNAMSYTAFTASFKPVGPATPVLRGTVTAGTATDVIIDVWVVDKVR